MALSPGAGGKLRAAAGASTSGAEPLSLARAPRSPGYSPVSAAVIRHSVSLVLMEAAAQRSARPFRSTSIDKWTE